MGERPCLAAVLLAIAYHLTWWRYGIAPVTCYLSAVALMGQPALLVYLLTLTMAWCDWGVILMAITIGVHHLLFDLVLPWSICSRGGDLARVNLHVLLSGKSPMGHLLSRYLADRRG
jgi:two-component system sensor histidine kinase/response regulator